MCACGAVGGFLDTKDMAQGQAHAGFTAHRLHVPHRFPRYDVPVEVGAARSK